MIRRTRLLDELVADAGSWLIEASAGFGKTLLIEQFVDEMATSDRPVLNVGAPHSPKGDGLTDGVVRAAERGGHVALAASIAEATRPDIVARVLDDVDAVVVVDRVERWDPASRDLLVDLLLERRRGAEQVVAGRYVGASMRQRLQRLEFNEWYSADLAFSSDETSQALAEAGFDAPELATMLHQICTGWPEATMRLVRRVASAQDPTGELRRLAQAAPDMEALVAAALDGLEPTDRSVARALSVAPAFDLATAGALGDDASFERLACAGLSFDRGVDGWYRFFEPTRRLLRGAVGPDELSRASGLVEHFWQREQLDRALRLCLDLGDRGEAARRLASVEDHLLGRLDPERVDSVIAAIGSAVGEAPRCLYVQALLHARTGNSEASMAAAEQACDWFARVDPDRADSGHLEALMHRANWHAFTGDIDAASTCADECSQLIDADQPSDLLGHLRDLEGLVALVRGSAADLEVSRTKLLDALAVWRSLRRPALAAATTFRLTNGVLGELGRWDEALQTLDELPLIGDLSPRHRAVLALERALVLPWLGAAAEVHDCTVEVRRLASVLGHPGLAREAAVADVVAAGVLRDASRLRRVADELERSDAAESDMVAAFALGEVAIACARCGLRAEAERALDAARAVPDFEPSILEYCAGLVDALLGEPSEARQAGERLAAIVDSTTPAERWHIAFVTAVAYHRSGDRSAAREWRHRSDRMAEELGAPDLASRLDRPLVELMDDADPAAPPASGYRVSLFDGFRVTDDGEELTIPPGQASTLIKLIVLGGDRLVVDQAIDALWPDASPDVGRRRFRNVLKRARGASRGLIEREGDMLRLAAGSASDFADAHRAATTGLDARATSLDVDRALEACRGELLAEDRYEDWAEDARRHLQSRVAALWDRRATLDEQASDINGAVAALRMGDRKQPGRWDRRGHAAQLLRQAGRVAEAEAELAGWDDAVTAPN